MGLDTAPFICFIEEHPVHLKRLQPFFAALDRGEFIAVTSTVTLLEVLVHPIRQGNEKIAARYRDILQNAKNLIAVPLSVEVAESAARLRATHNLRTPDAIQLATALTREASAFLTNDSHLPKIPEIKVIILDDIRE